MDFLHRGGLERDDGGDVVHHARVAEHALDVGFGEALEDGAQHLDARGVGEDADLAVAREGVEVEFARLDGLGVEDLRSSPRRLGGEQRKRAGRVYGCRI